MRLKKLIVTVGAAVLAGAFALPVSAQPKGKGQAAKEKVKAKREKMKERKGERKERHKEMRGKRREKRERHKELKEKEATGQLTDEEKTELADLEKRHAKLKERHKELKEKYKARRSTWKKRRREARRRVLEKYPDIKEHPKAIAEMKVHARRMARLQRAKAVAEAGEREGMTDRIDKLIAKEKARHQKRIDAAMAKKAEGEAK